MPEFSNPAASAGGFRLELESLDSPTAPVKLRRVALPLEGAERFQWRLAAVLVALSACRAKTASVDQLHTLVWAINDPTNAEVLRQVWEGAMPSRRPKGYVSGLLQTLRIAQVEGLVEQQTNGRQKLTNAGIQFVSGMSAAEVDLGDGQALLLSLAPISSAEMDRKLGGSA